MVRTHIVLILAACSLGAAATAQSAEPLAGTWGAADATLILGHEGGRLSQGCTLVTLDPVRLDARGHFSTPGRIESLSALPPDETADEDMAERAATKPATLTGEMKGGELALTLTVAGETPHRMTLILGQRGQPARCL